MRANRRQTTVYSYYYYYYYYQTDDVMRADRSCSYDVILYILFSSKSALICRPNLIKEKQNYISCNHIYYIHILHFELYGTYYYIIYVLDGKSIPHDMLLSPKSIEIIANPINTTATKPILQIKSKLSVNNFPY